MSFGQIKMLAFLDRRSIVLLRICMVQSKVKKGSGFLNAFLLIWV